MAARVMGVAGVIGERDSRGSLAEVEPASHGLKLELSEHQSLTLY